MSLVQSMDDTVTLDSSGEADLVFDSAFDQAVVCAASPIASGVDGTALVSATAQKVGTKTVRVRVWALTGTGANTVAPAAGRQVTVTLMAFTH